MDVELWQTISGEPCIQEQSVSPPAPDGPGPNRAIGCFSPLSVDGSMMRTAHLHFADEPKATAILASTIDHRS